MGINHGNGNPWQENKELMAFRGRQVFDSEIQVMKACRRWVQTTVINLR